MIYYLSCLFSIAALLSGMHILWIGTWKKHSFFEARHWLYAALVLSLFLSAYYIPIAAQHGNVTGATLQNQRWGIYHLLDRLVVLIFHWHIRLRVIEWKGAMKVYGRDRRNLKIGSKRKLEIWA